MTRARQAAAAPTEVGKFDGGGHEVLSSRPVSGCDGSSAAKAIPSSASTPRNGNWWATSKMPA